ncbi:SPOR domain-containing protein [Candidatus Vallotia tarda]|nr:SPOR domain-containing protein [Candidatus Vallotia tarda]
MEKSRRSSSQNPKRRSGILPGIALGLIVGLSIAIIVAIYLREAPTPFLSKVNLPESTCSTSNNNVPFDPNRALSGKSATPSVIQLPLGTALGEMVPQSHLMSALLEEPQIIEIPSTTSDTAAQLKPEKPLKPEDTLVSSGCIGKTPNFVTLARSSAASQNLGNVSNVNTVYFLQVGAYHTEQDAERRRAELALQGFEPKVTQRSAGEVVYYRVRIGPFLGFEDIENAQHQMSNAGVSTTVIRVMKQ